MSRKTIVVFCGPPCSGKSVLHEQLKESLASSETSEVWSAEMDTVSRDELSGPVSDEPRRRAAYRILHYKLTEYLLRPGPGIALITATYIPQRARAELASIAHRLRSELFVVQTVCTPSTAVERFLKRLNDEKDHPATDLTVKLVRELSERYERFNGALTIDSTLGDRQGDLLRIVRYIGAGAATNPTSWASHVYLPGPTTQKIHPEQSEELLSRRALKRAKHVLRRHFWGRWVIRIFVALGIVAFLPRLISVILQMHDSTADVWIPAGWEWFLALAHVRLVDAAVWATFATAAAGIMGLYVTFREENREERIRAKALLSAGEVPRFPIPSDANTAPPDREVFCAYYYRLLPERKCRMPIDSVPVFFLVPPRHRYSFNVKVVLSNGVCDHLPNDAAAMALDWHGFAAWRQDQRTAEGVTAGDETNLRCLNVGWPQGDKVCLVSACSSKYMDFVCREQSVNLYSPGVLPDMRRLFEGVYWDRGSIDPLNLSESAKRYSMQVGVNGLLITSDGHFVLQRRSNRVSTGRGSLGPAVGGAADLNLDYDLNYSDLRGLPRWMRRGAGLLKVRSGRFASPWDLRYTFLREIEEEIGIAESHLVLDHGGTFIGAAFNLRYGRDLNFYACATTKLTASEISEQHQAKIKTVKEKWEVDRLEFLDAERVTASSLRRGELDLYLPQRNRHLLGALYSWAIFQDRL